MDTQETQKEPVAAQTKPWTDLSDAVKIETAEPSADIPAVRETAEEDAAAEMSAAGTAAAPPPEEAATPPETEEHAAEVPTDGSAAAESAVAETAAEPPGAEEAAPLSDEEVLAHTAALWEYHPVPADEPDAAPEYRSAAMQIGAAEMIAARVRGKKHKHDGSNCDDWFAAVHAEDIAILAVSDGAGSKRLSRVGARAASEAAVGAVYAGLQRLLTAHAELRAACALPMEEAAFGDACAQLAGILHEGVCAARVAVESAFYERCGRAAYRDLLGRDPVLADFAATLLVTLAVPVPERAELLVLSCQIGDGMTAAVNTHAAYGSAVKLLGRPDSGDYVGETDFLTSDGMTDSAALQNRTLVSRGAYDLLLTMTDGVADDYFNEQELHRLYLDLALNGILPAASEQTMFTRAEACLLRSLPKPTAFPWVNDKTEQVALQSAQRCCTGAGCTVETLWQSAHVLPLAVADTTLARVSAPAQRLEIWLDNYMARGSFDDRTLVLLSMGAAHV